VLAPEEIIKAAGWASEIVRRHEIGHCNGGRKTTAERECHDPGRSNDEHDDLEPANRIMILGPKDEGTYF
jgi:hypothetical protein